VLGLGRSVLLVLGLAQCLAAVSLRPAADLYSATRRLARHLRGRAVKSSIRSSTAKVEEGKNLRSPQTPHTETALFLSGRACVLHPIASRFMKKNEAILIKRPAHPPEQRLGSRTYIPL